MTEQDKQLLIKDLCARIPYHTFVQLNPGAYNKPETCLLTGVHGEKIHLNVDSDPFRIDHIKSYLRPMSSMTEEEKNECFGRTMTIDIVKTSQQVIDWLLSHHFDFRGLIPMNLAIEAPKNMYKTE